MPRYDYRCPEGHVVEHVCSMADVPPTIECREPDCGLAAERVFAAPAAIHFRGPGFYATDVKGAQERRRRPNPGDDLPREHDRDADRIARSL